LGKRQLFWCKTERASGKRGGKKEDGHLTKAFRPAKVAGLKKRKASSRKKEEKESGYYRERGEKKTARSGGGGRLS